MSRQEAQEEALKRAKQEIRRIDLAQRCELLDMPVPDKKALSLRLFGADMILLLDHLDLYIRETDEPAKLGDHILLLHYLLHEKPINLTGEMISFRALSGGQFYWQPFLNRSVNPLLKRLDGDLALLEKNLARFDWEKFNGPGELNARIHCFGKIYTYLIYHRGDEEFPAEISFLFDSFVKDVLSTEDVAALASRICLGLL